MIQKEAKVVLCLQLVLFGQTPLGFQSIFRTVSVAVCQTVGFILDTSIFPSTGSALWTLFFFCSGGKDSWCVSCSVPLSLLISHSRCEATSEARAVFTLAQQWPSAAWCTELHSDCFLVLNKRRKKQAVEVLVTGHHMSYWLVGRGQLKSTAMLSLLDIRMPLQPLIWAAGRSFFSPPVHGTSASLFQHLNDRFTSERQPS